MKMKPEHYEELKRDIAAVLDKVAGNPFAWCKDEPNADMGRMWLLAHIVEDNRRYDDTHPRWKHADRVLPFDHPGYCLYRGYLNDSHLDTALRRIGRELGLIQV